MDCVVLRKRIYNERGGIYYYNIPAIIERIVNKKTFGDSSWDYRRGGGDTTPYREWPSVSGLRGPHFVVWLHIGRTECSVLCDYIILSIVFPLSYFSLSFSRFHNYPSGVNFPSFFGCGAGPYSQLLLFPPLFVFLFSLQVHKQFPNRKKKDIWKRKKDIPNKRSLIGSNQWRPCCFCFCIVIRSLTSVEMWTNSLCSTTL